MDSRLRNITEVEVGHSIETQEAVSKKLMILVYGSEEKATEVARALAKLNEVSMGDVKAYYAASCEAANSEFAKHDIRRHPLIASLEVREVEEEMAPEEEAEFDAFMEQVYRRVALDDAN